MTVALAILELSSIARAIREHVLPLGADELIVGSMEGGRAGRLAEGGHELALGANRLGQGHAVPSERVRPVPDRRFGNTYVSPGSTVSTGG